VDVDALRHYPSAWVPKDQTLELIDTLRADNEQLTGQVLDLHAGVEEAIGVLAARRQEIERLRAGIAEALHFTSYSHDEAGWAACDALRSLLAEEPTP
jgi:hypothetical protein